MPDPAPRPKTVTMADVKLALPKDWKVYESRFAGKRYFAVEDQAEDWHFAFEFLDRQTCLRCALAALLALRETGREGKGGKK
jgi:hypothetical protein